MIKDRKKASCTFLIPDFGPKIKTEKKKNGVYRRGASGGIQRVLPRLMQF